MFEIVKREELTPKAVVEEMEKRFARAVVDAAETERSETGVVVPTPIAPLVARKSEEVAVMTLVPEKYGNCPVVPEYREEVARERVGEEPPTRAPKVPPVVKPRP